jgi:hypothetical protein
VVKIPLFHPVGFAAEILNQKGINRLRFGGAEELLGQGAALIDTTGRERLGGSRFLLVAQATRAQHTFEAVIANCQIGRGVQAAMLNRSLLDDVLDIHWTAEHPDEATERADQHDRLIALAEHELEDKFDRADRSLTDGERAELDKLMKLYAGERGKSFDRAWHRTDFNECFALVKRRWDTEPDTASALDYIYEVIQRRNNLLLHGSSTAYRQTLVERPNGRHGLDRIGPDQLWREALAHGAGGYYMVQRVLAQEFELDKDPLAAAFNQLSCYCRHIDEFEDLEELHEDAECPCGSDRAVSDCHRS